MNRHLLAATLLALALSACSSSATEPTTTTAAAAGAPASTAAAPATSAPAAAAADPYDEYLRLVDELGITDAPELTRDDAQLRALLGCGTAWAPGTVDAALQQAYASLIEQWKQQGQCGG